MQENAKIFLADSGFYEGIRGLADTADTADTGISS